MREEIEKVRKKIFSIIARPIDEEKLRRISDHETRIEGLDAEISRTARELQDAISRRASETEINALKEKMGFQGRRVDAARRLLAEVKKEMERQ